MLPCTSSQTIIAQNLSHLSYLCLYLYLYLYDICIEQPFQSVSKGGVNWEEINCCLAAPAKPLLHTICPRFTVLDMKDTIYLRFTVLKSSKSLGNHFFNMHIYVIKIENLAILSIFNLRQFVPRPKPAKTCLDF